MTILYIVPLPQGDPDDITMRALRILGEVRAIATDDIGAGRALLDGYGISTPLIGYGEALNALAGGDVALVSTKGTPGLGVGQEIVQAVIAQGFQVVPLPGADAGITALVLSGLPTDAFVYVGMLPDDLSRYADERATLIFTASEAGAFPRLLDAFGKSPLAKNTVIALWSDHGWHLGEKLHWRKFTLWEEATHNVLMMKVPGLTVAGGRCDRPVSLMDVFPTLTDVCGLPPKKECEGVSLRPLLKDPKAKWARPAVTTFGKANHAVRSERWRYIRYSDGTEELYDRQADPMEWKNLAGDPKLAAVKAEHGKWLPKVNAAEIPSRGNG